MAEYIKREALINELSASCMPIDDREISGLFDCDESIRDIIDAMPAADVRPERHGRWIPEADYGICSECGADHSIFDTEYVAYCPGCGAKMDGKDGE